MKHIKNSFNSKINEFTEDVIHAILKLSEIGK